MRPAPSLTTDPIPQLTLRIAIPAGVGMFFNTMFNVADTVCAGWLGTDALAALAISFPLFFVLFAVGSGLSQGATALIANALGAGDFAGARRVFCQTVVLCVVSGLALSVACWLAAPRLLVWLGAGEYLDTALAYLHIIIAGGIFLMLPMTLNATLSAQGETRVYRNYLIAGFVANCVLNPVLMWGWGGLPRMGVGGIALATVLIQIAGTAWMWRRVLASELCYVLPVGDFLPDAATLRRIAAQAVPAVFSMLSIAAGIFVTTWFVQAFGKEAVAATGIATRIEQIVLMPAIGLSSAMLSLTGQNFGAGLPGRVREAWRANLYYGCASMLAGGMLLWLLREPAMMLFTSDTAVIARGCDYLSVAAPTLTAYSILFGTVFLMQGLKRPAYGLWMGLVRQVIAPLPVIYLLVHGLGWGLWGVWIGLGVVAWSAALFALWWGARELRALPTPAQAPPPPSGSPVMPKSKSTLKFALMLILLVTLFGALSGCAYTAPWRKFPATATSGKAIVVITGVEIEKGQRAAFFKYTRQVLAGMDTHEGLLGYSFRFQIFKTRAWTITAWQDEASLKRFVRSKTHQIAMEEGSRTTKSMRFHTVELAPESLPLPWAEAIKRVQPGDGGR